MTPVVARLSARAILLDDDARVVLFRRTRPGREVYFSRVFLFSSVADARLTVQYVYVCRLVSMDVSTRNGPEFNNPSRGRFDPDPVPLLGDSLTSLALKPLVLRDFIVSNQDALLAEISHEHGLSGHANG